MILRHILTFYVCLLSIVASAQTDSVYYFDRDGKTVNNRSQAEFYRVIDGREADTYRFTEYRKDGSTVKALATGKITSPKYIGDVSLYYPNGKVHERHDYADGRPVRTLRYHPNGTLLQTVLYDEHYNRLIYEADSTGKENIVNGDGNRIESGTYFLGLSIREQYTMEGPYIGGLKNGLWKGKDDRGIYYEEIYVNDARKSGTSKSVDGKKYSYTDIYSFPRIDQKRDDIFTFIKNNLKQPADTLGLANWNNLLSINYTVTEKGELMNLYGFSKADHAKIYLELKKQPSNITPARLRGVPVNCEITSGYGMIFKPSGRPSPFNNDVYLNGTYKPVSIPVRK